MSLILKNACFIDQENLCFSNKHIRIGEGDGESPEFCNTSAIMNLSDEDVVIDCRDEYVTASFAVGHHHAYSALVTGMPSPKKTPSCFHEILKYIWWKLDRVLDKDIIEASALVTAIACAKAGATFIIDHHSSPDYIKGSLELIASAFEKVGISHLLCYEISDRDGPEKARLGFEETEAFLKKHQGLVGLHASFTVGDDTLMKASALMKNTNSGIHIHVAEDDYDQQHCMTHYNKRVVERLYDSGVLDSSGTILVHCLHINDHEREIIKKSPAFVVQNTESNFNNNVGLFNSKSLGTNIMLGTDGMHSDMIRSAQAAYFAGQINAEIDNGSAYLRFRKINDYLAVNNFKGNGPNNLVVLDYNPPTEFNKDNFTGHFIFGLSSNHVKHVISNGKLIVKDRIIQTVDEKEILNFAKEQSVRLWKNLQH